MIIPSLVPVGFEINSLNAEQRAIEFVDAAGGKFAVLLSSELEHKLWLELKPPYAVAPKNAMIWK